MAEELMGRWLRILDILQASVGIREEDFATLYIYRSTRDPFKALVATILSQNTSDVNALKAYRALEERIGVSVEALHEASEEELREAIRQAGMYRQRANKLKQLARALREAGQGHLERLLSLPPDEALRALMALPGVGPKTAEVLLATVSNAPYLPIDTHVRRVTLRLGLHSGGDYARVRAALEAITPPGLRHRAHLLLIAFGRAVCRARRPLCYACPVERLCPYPYKTALEPRERLG